MNQTKRVEFLKRLRKANPRPTTELYYDSPFELMIAVILSAQATDKSVNQATEKLFKRASTPQQLKRLGEARLKGFIKSIGLFNSKARNIIKACEMLLDEHGGTVPQDRAALERLPGVGRKTANVILNTAFGEPTIAVDTHIFRVSNRTGFAPGKTVRVVEDKLLKVVPDDFKRDVHHWLILHGRYTCVARKPKCAECPVSDLCDYRHKTPPT